MKEYRQSKNRARNVRPVSGRWRGGLAVPVDQVVGQADKHAAAHQDGSLQARICHQRNQGVAEDVAALDAADAGDADDSDTEPAIPDLSSPGVADIPAPLRVNDARLLQALKAERGVLARPTGALSTEGIARALRGVVAAASGRRGAGARKYSPDSSNSQGSAM